MSIQNRFIPHPYFCAISFIYRFTLRKNSKPFQFKIHFSSDSRPNKMKSLKLTLKKTKNLKSIPDRADINELTESAIAQIRRYVRRLELDHVVGDAASKGSNSSSGKAAPVVSYEWFDSFKKKWYRWTRKSTVSQSVFFEIGCQRFNQAVIERQVAKETKDPLKAVR